jgi:ADP-dependent NAD(P)H-hydrate dehydratase / NAD(P)H-hydrate epimerase
VGRRVADRPLGFGRRSTADGAAADSKVAPQVPGATLLDDDVAAGLLPDRPERGHKGSFGRLLVVAGSLDYAGSAFLVCAAAGRSGAGLVTLAVPESLQPLFAAKVVEATTMALPEDDVEELEPDEALARILDHEHDAIVVGPGIRPGLATRQFIADLLAVEETRETGEGGEGVPAHDGRGLAPPPIVLDAEALRALASTDTWWERVRRLAVLTPHIGEFARLRAGSGHDPEVDGDLIDDDAARATAAGAAAREWGQVVVLKGARTVIAAPDGALAVARFVNPAMATGGTGDVLAGTIGSLLAQGLDPFAAARLGVHLHGLAGDAIRDRLGDAGLLASDLPLELAFARRRLAVLAKRKNREGKLGFAPRSAGYGREAEPEPESGEVRT